jgi:hypothetical protein
VTFSSAEKGRQQVVELENEAEHRAPAQGETGIVKPARLFALDPVATGGQAFEQADNVEQRALARARRADKRDELAAVDGKGNAVQHFSLVGQAQVVALVDADELDQPRHDG